MSSFMSTSWPSEAASALAHVEEAAAVEKAVHYIIQNLERTYGVPVN